jgi:hypothetical protein
LMILQIAPIALFNVLQFDMPTTKLHPADLKCLMYISLELIHNRRAIADSGCAHCEISLRIR